MNNIMLFGTLQKEPMFLNPNKENTVAKITLVVEYESNNKLRTNYFDCTGFGDVAIYIKNNINVKDQVFIEGYLEKNKFKNKAGKEVYTTDIIIEKINSLNEWFFSLFMLL